MFVEAGISALSLAEYTIEHEKNLKKQINKLRLWLKRGKLSIAVFGPGGTGKSTLGLFLVGKLPPGGTGAYRENLDLEECEIDGLVCKLLVTPGQPRRRASHFPKLFRDISAGKTTGVINVVSYGFHSFENQLKANRLFTAGMTSEDFMKNYLVDRREEEIKLVKELVAGLSIAKGPLWMLTVVLKQDLWWDDRAQVEKYYKEGQYEQHIHSLLTKLGAENFSHDYLSASPIICNFATQDGLVLAKNTAGYDQPTQYANSAKLIYTVMTRSGAKTAERSS
jgi:hypothetical protein